MLEMQNKNNNENFLFTRKIWMTQTIIEIDCFHLAQYKLQVKTSPF